MKTKITLILTFLAASVFAFAEVSAENSAPAAAPEKAQACPKTTQACPKTTQACSKTTQACPKARPAKCPKACPQAHPQATPDQRLAFIRHMLLTRSDEELAQLAAELDAVRKMTAEEKAEALKALPKPEFARCPAPAPAGKMCGNERPAPRGKKPGCRCGSKGAPLPPPPPPALDPEAPAAPVEE